MCEFLSWIEEDGKVFYLTPKQIFNTTRGKALQKFCESQDDYVGHGAIRHYYHIAQNDGNNRECVDFSTPDDFPAVLVEAIKAGKFRGFNEQPAKLLPDQIDKAYREQVDQIDKAYREQVDQIDKAYQEQRDTIDKAYREQRDKIHKT